MTTTRITVTLFDHDLEIIEVKPMGDLWSSSAFRSEQPATRAAVTDCIDRVCDRVARYQRSANSPCYADVRIDVLLPAGDQIASTTTQSYAIHTTRLARSFSAV